MQLSEKCVLVTYKSRNIIFIFVIWIVKSKRLKNNFCLFAVAVFLYPVGMCNECEAKNKWLQKIIRLHYWNEWGSTARNLIARQSFAQNFWQEINCSKQNISTARIQWILAKLDSSKWQKSDNCSVEQLTLKFLRQ